MTAGTFDTPTTRGVMSRRTGQRALFHITRKRVLAKRAKLRAIREAAAKAKA